MARAVRIVDDFAPEARALRAEFDTRFADPRKATAGRFVWDWWHVPGQYTQLRTPAWQYFSPALYRALHTRLVQWGRANLGCHDISPPWLSLYVDGCGQELHADLPHGPWAFVYSLTPWAGRAFTGGETVLLREEVLDYWMGLAYRASVERDQIERTVAPTFGRLVVFDPRIPHGVRRVAGTTDPRAGRLVINGWFVQPRPFITGPLPRAAVARRIAELVDAIATWSRDGLWITGTIAFAIAVSAAGRVRSVRVLSDTSRPPRQREADRRFAVKHLRDTIRGWTFPARPRPSTITLPLVFAG
jgi:hypothetical protein